MQATDQTGNNMLIRQLSYNTFDVFIGDGWDNWTRIRKFHWGFKPIAGQFIPRHILREVAISIESGNVV